MQDGKLLQQLELHEVKFVLSYVAPLLIRVTDREAFFFWGESNLF